MDEFIIGKNKEGKKMEIKDTTIKQTLKSKRKRKTNKQRHMPRFRQRKNDDIRLTLKSYVNKQVDRK